MTLYEAYKGIKAEIRRLEEKREKYEQTKHLSHVLHLLLTIVTGGFWLIVWIGLAVFKIELLKPKFYKELEELYTLRDEAEIKLYLKK